MLKLAWPAAALATLFVLDMAMAEETAGPVQPRAPIEGVWVARSGSEVTIERCEAGFCGYLSRIVVPDAIAEVHKADLEALAVEDLTDYYNKNPDLRGRRLLGLQILTVVQAGSKLRYAGQVYNPEDGNLYAGMARLLDLNHMKLQGCVLAIFCDRQDFVRLTKPATN